MKAVIYHNDYRATVEGDGILMRFYSQNPQHVDHWIRYQRALLRQFGYTVTAEFVSEIGAQSN